jgi:lipid-A-disaccharide synthase
MKALISAGETSGDIYGGGLATELQKKDRSIHLFGMGGDHMRKNGVEILFDCGKVAVVGVFEVAGKLKNLQEAYRDLTRWIESNNPDFAVLVDFPDFNFRLARYLKKKRIPVFYFISPQIWAWRKKRIHFLRDHIKLMISILPFEQRMYERAGVPCIYVGHPLKEFVLQQIETQKSRPRIVGKLRVGLMPGSRETEVKRHLPILLETMDHLKKQLQLEADMIWAPSLNEDSYRIPHDINVIRHDRYAAMKACDFLIVASGTSTLEAAILGVPFTIVYRVGPVSWKLGKLLVRVPYYGLVNWIAEQKVVSEFIQSDMRPDLLAAETISYLNDAPKRNLLKQELKKVVDRLGPPGAMDRAAVAILDRL